MNRSVLISMMVVALSLRLLWIFSINHEEFDKDFWIDDARAQELLHDGSYSFKGVKTAFFPVGYPFFLSVLYRLFGPSLLVGKIANALLGSILCVLTALIAKIIFDVRTGTIAGWIMVFYPNNIFYSSLLLSEILLATLLAFTVLMIISHKFEPHYLLVAGILVGLCMLVRAVAVILPVCILIYWYKTKKKKLLQHFVLMIIGAALVIAPWSIRNYRVMHHFVLVSTNGGVNFWMAHIYGGYAEAPMRFSANWGFRATSPEQEVIAEKQAYREAFDYLKKDPLEPLKRFPKKFLRFFYADIDGLLNNSGFPVVTSISDLRNVVPILPISLPLFFKWLMYLYAQGFYVLVIITALIGIIQSIRNNQSRSYFLMIIVLGWTLFHTLIFFALGRYRFPLMPLLIVFSAFGVAIVSESKIFRRKPDR
jgi:4-amino-4-deoxy-L-arabinose transferase-like glycosyltransferase